MATCTRHIVVEDLGGAPADLDEDAHPQHLGDEKHELHLPVDKIRCVLARVAERAAAARPGRPRDVHKQMWNVAEPFSAVLDSVQDPFPTQHHGNGGMGADIHAALEYQADVAERLRQQQDPESRDSVAEDGEDANGGDAALTEEAAKLLQSTPASAARQGPLVFAKCLADAATLNADQ